MTVMGSVIAVYQKYSPGDYLLRTGFYLTVVILVYHCINPGQSLTKGGGALFDDVQLVNTSPPVFQAEGCAMFGYQSSNARKCLRNKAVGKRNTNFLFIGDSRTMELFTSMAGFVKPGYASLPEGTKSAALDDPMLGVGLKYLSSKNIDELRQQLLREGRKISRERSQPIPDLVVLGMGWKNDRKTDGELDEASLKDAWSLALPSMDEICENTLCLWMPPEPTTAKPGPVQESTEAALYNTVAKQFLERAHVTLWMSALKIANFKLSDPSNTIYLWQQHFGGMNSPCHKKTHYMHILEGFFVAKSQLLWNWLCNEDLQSKLHTCFTGGYVKKTMFTFFTPVVVILFIIYECASVYIRRCYLANTTDVDQAKKIGHRLDLLGSIIKLGLIMAYFHLCDREDVVWIKKEVKQYSHGTFFISLSLVALAGFLTLRKSEDVSLLHRQQTEEWKGWMQLVILVYHFTGASKVLAIYYVVRPLVTSYLLLNGYGQFTFFFLRGDFSVMRILQTFIRLNLLVLLLCLVMNRAYQFYYFVPLVTFWFVVIYTTMAVFPRITLNRIEGKQSKGYWFAGLGVKLFILTVVITLSYVWQDGFKRLFSTPVLAPMFALNGNVHEWLFRWQLDRYSVVCGMFLGLAYQYMKRHQVIHESPERPLFSSRVAYLLTIMASVLLAGYSAFALLCLDKYRCNVFYPYFGYLPVLSFVLLRNMYPSVRSSYSTLFVWFGKISLELFISQYHIWLADDTKKILVLIPGFPVLNVLTTSLIFVAICCEIQAATSHFASYCIQKKAAKPPLLPKS